MLSILKSKATYIPDSVYKLVKTKQADPDEKPSSNNILELRCLDVNGTLLAQIRMESSARKFNGKSTAIESGICTDVHVSMYWAKTNRWVSELQSIEGGNWILYDKRLIKGNLITFDCNIHGDDI